MPDPFFTAINVTTVKYLQTRVTAVEQQLKAISAANQSDRKALAASHASLSERRGCSREDATQKSQSIREKLLILASKQKRLLECFVTQKEIATRLSKLLEKRKDAERHATDINRPQPSTLSPSHGLPPNISAALPDLARHLRKTGDKAGLGAVNHTTAHSELQGVSNRSSDAMAGAFKSKTKTNQQSLAITNQVPGVAPGVLHLIEPCQLQHRSLPAPPLSPLRQASTHPPAVRPSNITTTAVTTTVRSTTLKVAPPQILQQPDPLGLGAAGSAKVMSQCDPPQSQEAGKRPPDLAQLVPLDILIKYGFISPGRDCISCSLMVC